MQALVIIFLILAILLMLFTMQNSIGITIHVFFWEIMNAPLALVVLICVVFGYLLASAYFFPKVWKLKKERNLLIKQNARLKEKSSMIQPVKENPEGDAFDEGDEDFF